MRRARETFATGQRVISKGQEFADDDPIVRDHPDFFEEVGEAPRRGTRKRTKPKTGDGGDEQ